MKHLLSNIVEFFTLLPDALHRKKAWVWLAFVLLTLFLAFGIPKNTFDMSIDSWFSKDDPVKQALNHFKQEFGSDDTIYLVYKPKDGDLFSQASLKAVIGIRDAILDARDNLQPDSCSMLSHVTRVDSLASAKILKSQDGALISQRFIGADIPLDAAEREALRKEALAQKNFSLFYFSKDFQYGAIVIQTDLGTETVDVTHQTADFDTTFEMDIDAEMVVDTTDSDKALAIEYKPVDMADYGALMDDIEAVILQPKFASHLKYYPVGNPPMMMHVARQLAEIGPIFLGMLILIVILLWMLFRSFSAVVWPTLIVIITCIWTMGAAGWLGSTITTMITLTLLLLLAVGIADAVHIISGYHYLRNQQIDHRRALRMAFRKAALPCLLTSVTTMLGMLSLTMSSISHIRTFGYMSAMGVGFAFCITVFLLPLMLDLLAPGRKGNRFAAANRKKHRFHLNPAAILQRRLELVLPWVEKWPWVVVGGFFLVFCVCVYGATQIKIDSNMVEAFKKGSELRISYDIVDTYMAGTNTMEIFIDGGRSDALLDPRVLKQMAVFQQVIEQKYDHLIARTFSLANVVKDAYQVLNDGVAQYYAIPDTTALLSQTLFMFNNANPEDRRRLVSDDYRKTHISVQLYNAGSYEYTEFFKNVQADMALAFGPLKKTLPEFSIDITGSMALLMRLADYIGWSQVKSLGTVIITISVLMFFIFGSPRVGLMSIIPNMIPATLIFGLIGLLDLALDSDTIIIAPVIIGIAVDDTIHMITHYRDEVLRSGHPRHALEHTIHEVGQAVSFTTLILGLGFFLLVFSSNTSFIKVGAFGSLAIFAALLCDLLLLPALIVIFKPRFVKRTQAQALTTA